MAGKERISGLQLFTVTGCYALGTIMRSVYVTMIAGRDSWMMAFTGAIAYLPLFFAILALAKRFPGMSLFQINEAVFGKACGRVLSCVYTYYIITLCAQNTLDASVFIKSFTMPATPLPVIVLVFVLFGAYAVRKGFEPLARVSSVLLAGASLVLVANSVLALTEANFSFLLPMFSFEPIKYVQATHLSANIPYGESFILLTLLPLLKGGGDALKKPLTAGLLFTMAVIFMVRIREAVMLGPLLPYVLQPSYETIRLIDLGNTIARVESLYAFIMTSVTFFKICALYYAACSGIAAITGISGHKPTVLVTGALLTAYALRLYPADSADSLYWMANVGVFFSTVVQYALPLITLAAAAIKAAYAKRGARRREVLNP